MERTANESGGRFEGHGSCCGTGGIYRIDRSWNLNWLYGTFGAHVR